MIFDGREVAEALTESLSDRVYNLKKRGVEPKLVMLRVGEKPNDMSYERTASKKLEKMGIAVSHIVLPENCSESELLGQIEAINKDDSIHGCLMFRPLDNKELEIKAANLLDPKKDVDSMTPVSLTSEYLGNREGFVPCTAQACMEILDYYHVDLSGKHVAIIGRSHVVGKPLAMLLQNRDATITMCHSKTKNLPGVCSRADILISAAGKAGFVNKYYVNPSQIVLDVGINFNEDGKMCGDVDFDQVSPIVWAITPVPGGVGPMTIAMLMKNTLTAALRKNGLA